MRALLICFDRTISLQVLYCLAATPADVHVIGIPGTECLAFSRHCRSYTRHKGDISAASLPEWIDDLNAVIAAKSIEIVVPGDTRATLLLACIAPSLVVATFPVPGAAEFARLADKWHFYTSCISLGIPTPKTVLVENKSAIEPDCLEAAIGFPMVIKPTDQGNSVGVVILHSRAEMLARVIDNSRYSFERLIAQEFVPGIDIDCSVLAIGGRLICAAVQVRRRRAVMFMECDRLFAACSAVMEHARFNGVAHFDAREEGTTGEVKLIECNPRFWASIDAARWCGLNFVAAGIKLAVGNAVEVPPRLTLEGGYLHPAALAAAILMLRWRNPGLSRASLHGLAQALSDPIPFVAIELHAWRRRREERVRLAGSA